VHSLLRFAYDTCGCSRGVPAAFALARFLRDFKVARLLLKSKFAREMSPQFEFALELLDSSSANGRAAAMPAAPQRAGAPIAFLFKACVTEGLFQRVNAATRRVLAANNCAVQTPVSQVCCGALHAHAGDLDGARTLARQNIDAFAGGEENRNAPIVTNAGGCGSMLVSYAHLLAHDANYADAARTFSARVRDVGQQLAAIGFRTARPSDRRARLTILPVTCYTASRGPTLL